MDTYLDELLVELRQHALELEPKLEGAHDYSRLNLGEAAKATAAQGIADYQQRKDLTLAAITALEALSGNTYPAFPRYTVLNETKSDLTNNSNTILAFLGQVDAEGEVTTGQMTFTDPVK
jgi:hypothetical protein